MTPIVAALLLQPQVPLAFMRYPDISGDRVCFNSEGDIWVGSLSTGEAHRLTSDAGLERTARFSPDGSQLTFMASYDGSPQIFVMPTSGGAPKRLTYGLIGRSVDWSPDSKQVFYIAQGVPRFQGFSIPAAGGAPERLPLEYVASYSPEPTGSRIAFTRNQRATAAWFNYIGGMQNQIWVGDLPAKVFKKITNVTGTNEYPYWSGNRIYFINEKNSKFTLMSVAPDGSGIKSVAGPYDIEIRELQGDGKRLIYEKGAAVEMFDTATGKTSSVTFNMSSDLLHTRSVMVPAQNYVQSSSISPTGKRVFVESRGQIVSLPVGEGEARVWRAKDGVRYRYPVMSPDASKVGYFSDESGEMALYVANADGASPRKLTTDGKQQLFNFKWSPDSKWLALQTSNDQLLLVDASTGATKFVAQHQFLNGTNTAFSPDSKWLAFVTQKPVVNFRQIQLYEIATGKTTPVSDGRADDRQMSFSADGKYLAFLSDRNLDFNWDTYLNQLNSRNPSIVCLLMLQSDGDNPLAPKDADEAKLAETKSEPGIDLEGLAARSIELPIPAATYGQLEFAGNRLLFTGEGKVSYYDIATKAIGTVTTGGGFEVSSDGKKLLLTDQTGLRVIDATATDAPATAGAVGFGGLSLRVNPKDEWTQIYWDSWRHLRDFFYVANMHGLDWQAVGKKYEAYLPAVRSRDEVDELIRWLQAELGCSHMAKSPGDEQSLKPTSQPSALGVDLAADSSGYYRISKIIRGDSYRTNERSPLAAPGVNVKEGDYLIEVAGFPARVGNDFMQGIVGRAGQIVSLKVNDNPSANGARTIRVKPISTQAEQRMRYVDWVESNRKYVEKASNGRIGYLHVASMGPQDVADFTKQYFAQRDKEALLVDDRFNTGGSVQDALNRILAQTWRGNFNERGSDQSWSRQGDAFIGPKACLINEFCISCGEEFPDRFRALKIGPLIGMRTMGGEVGNNPFWPLVDGGGIAVPRYGMYTEKGWVIEGEGVSPDIEVQSDPNAFVAGKDPQLDAGVKYLLDELKKRPVVRAKPPADRIRTGGGGR